MPSMDDFRQALRSAVRRAELQGLTSIDINAGELHRSLGGYPGTGNRMPACCDAMNELKRFGDEVIASPAKGKGASLTIRYRLPRK